jgi:hypothetical protein
MYDNIGTPLEVKTKKKKGKPTPVYKLGSADPCSLQKDTTEEAQEYKRSYSFPSGVDHKVFIDGENYGHIQAIMVRENRASQTSTGELITISSPGFISNKKILEKEECHILVKSADEFGHVEVAFDHKVRIDGYRWGVSIDDLVTETIIPFTILD